MIFNMVGGGGGSLKNTDAVLIVSVPTGSTVTATKGGVTITPTIWVQNADNTLDTAIFSVKASTFDSNTWTVTATLGASSASTTVIIDSAKEYELKLAYERILFYNGTTDAELGTFVAVASATIGTELTTTSNQSTGSYWCSDNSFVIPSNLTTLNFEAIVSYIHGNLDGYRPWFGIASSKITSGSIGPQQQKMVAYYTSGVTSDYVHFTVDISSYVGSSYYVAMVSIATTATRKIWLSE